MPRRCSVVFPKKLVRPLTPTLSPVGGEDKGEGSAEPLRLIFGRNSSDLLQ
jgi:hypothetical protein